MYSPYMHPEVYYQEFGRQESLNLNSLHMVVRFGCGVALVGYMSGRDTAQSLGYLLG